MPKNRGNHQPKRKLENNKAEDNGGSLKCSQPTCGQQPNHHKTQIETRRMPKTWRPAVILYLYKKSNVFGHFFWVLREIIGNSIHDCIRSLNRHDKIWSRSWTLKIVVKNVDKWKHLHVVVPGYYTPFLEKIYFLFFSKMFIRKRNVEPWYTH